MFKRTITSALIFGAAAIAPPSLAQAQSTQCMPRDALVERLQSKYGNASTAGAFNRLANCSKSGAQKNQEASRYLSHNLTA
ncbi:MAG: hypothetical protein AAFN80_02745 [Pseudomonadota bacterium]